MPINAPDYQPTRLTKGAARMPPEVGAEGAEPGGLHRATGTGSAAEVAEAAVPAPERPPGRRTGIVFVHGIGVQQPSETFLDWSAPIVRMLAEWRTGNDDPGDPVVRSEFSFSGASQSFLEVAVPAFADRPAATWVFTEAWWAADLRAPALGTVTRYLRSRLRRIVAGIASGYAAREQTWIRKRGRAVASAVLAAGAEVGPGVAGASPSVPGDPGSSAAGPVVTPPEILAELEPNRRWGWIDTLDKLQAKTFSLGILVLLLSGGGSLLLLLYGFLRQIPIGPIRDFAEARIIDSFLVDWFGDLPVLLDDPVQAANVRARVASSVDALVEDGCDSIVLVAHSGGAIVSFETLLDPAYDACAVDKLVTLGQGLALGWRLATEPSRNAVPRGSRLLGDLGAARPGLRWVDFWSSYDPAPAGPLPSNMTGVPLEVEDPPIPDQGPPPAPLVVENRAVTNRMNVLADHGGYWDNDEGFLLPLLRHLDTPDEPVDDSRFYRDETLRAVRIARRRQRVAVLAAWVWLAAIGGVGAVIVGTALDLGVRMRAGGHTLTAAWGIVPGHEIVSGPVDAAGQVIGGLAGTLGLEAAADALAPIGPLLVAVGFSLALVVALASFGNGRWDAWDLIERRAARPERLMVTDRGWVAGHGAALAGGLIGLIVAISTGSWVGTAVPLVVGAVGGLVIRLRTGSPRRVVAGPALAATAARAAPSAPSTPSAPAAPSAPSASSTPSAPSSTVSDPN